MQRLRSATDEEVEKIRATSDLDATCIVLALDTPQGTALAVIRNPVEVDPVYFPEGASTKLNAFFIRDIETFLSAKGISSYYFNCDPANEVWVEAVKHWGAEQVSTKEELRFKKIL